MHSELSLRVYKEKRNSSESTSDLQKKNENLKFLLLLDSQASQASFTVRDEMYFFLNDKVEMQITISN